MTTVEGKPLLTNGKLWAVFFVQLNEAYQITVLLPMVVFMVGYVGSFLLSSHLRVTPSIISTAADLTVCILLNIQGP